MKLLIKTTKIISDKHSWRRASDNFAHANGVSWLGWCKRCGCEAITGSLEKDSKCIYYESEYLEQWDGEDRTIVSAKQKLNAIVDCKKHMLRVLKKAEKAKTDLDWRNFQGTTSVAARATDELRNEGKIKIENNLVKLI